MNILILGSGGREHALAWKIAASPLTSKLYCAPGNAGIAQEAECVSVDIANHAAVIAFAKEKKIDLVVVGPETPLCAGITDDLESRGIKTFGPGKAAAQLEGSKRFAKDLCKAHNIPTAAYQCFQTQPEANNYIRTKGAPIVVKADGLAAGKGVVVAETIEEAQGAIDMMFGGGLGSPVSEIVIEDLLIGEEVSFFAMCDGDTAIPLGSAQDHKRVGDGDTGPNTGGMGAYSPTPVMTQDIEKRVMNEIISPTLHALKTMGVPYKGVLFAGLMITKTGPYLIEFNVRFGDPECQVLMLRLMSDLVPALLAACDRQLKNFDLRWYSDAALTVVMAAKGYPGSYEKGTFIGGLDKAAEVEGVQIFHASTKVANQSIIATGGRVLNICARGKNVREAKARAYRAVDRINWPNGFCRRDIGWRAIERE
jgi:phosphoribosylamine---glycine ligase